MAVRRISGGRDRAVVEKVRIEVERIFRTTIAPVVAVAKDEKLNTVVRVEVPTSDARAIQKLKAALQPLPQSYNVITRCA
jgi:fatty-acyl-CoA synthase